LEERRARVRGCIVAGALFDQFSGTGGRFAGIERITQQPFEFLEEGLHHSVHGLGSLLLTKLVG